MSENKLKPCPFCGGEAKLIGFHDCVEDENRIYIQCQSCNAQTKELLAVDLFSNGITTLDPVECIIKSWNTRTPVVTGGHWENMLDDIIEKLEHYPKPTLAQGKNYLIMGDAIPTNEAIKILESLRETRNKEVC